MKKIISMIAAASCMAIMASTAMAITQVPTYFGNTNSTIGVGNEPTGTSKSGYYIWSNDPERTSWSLRWTNQGNNGTNINWFGKIIFGADINTGGRAVDFETNSSPPDTIWVNNDDIIRYTAVAGPAWDGIDFTLNGTNGNVIGFMLGSDLDNGLKVGATVKPASDIFIGGGGASHWTSPDVLVQGYTNWPGKMVEDFNVPAPVPEPGTMMLLGAGFLGLAIYGKRRKNA